MKRINSWTELFNEWQKEADKYSALNRLRHHYDTELARITEPFHEDLFKFIEQNGATAVTPEVMDKLYEKVKPSVCELNKWYSETIAAICKHFE